MYNLNSEEAVILQDFNVVSNTTRKKVTLVLTNQNLIEITKDFWGAQTGTRKFSLLDLKILDGKANARVGKAPNGNARLEIYFKNCDCIYLFNSPFAERKWANAIIKAHKECISAEKKRQKAEAKDDAFFSPFLKTIDKVKESIKPMVKDTSIKTNKCPKCGQELTGARGDEVQCPYCESIIIIK